MIAAVIVVAAILLALGYTFVQQVTYVGARTIDAVAPIMPPTYQEKLHYLAGLRLKGDENSLRCATVMEAKMRAEVSAIYGH
jgi:hypothetical protein